MGGRGRRDKGIVSPDLLARRPRRRRPGGPEQEMARRSRQVDEGLEELSIVCPDLIDIIALCSMMTFSDTLIHSEIANLISCKIS